MTTPIPVSLDKESESLDLNIDTADLPRYRQTSVQIDLARLITESQALAWDHQCQDFRHQTSIHNSKGDSNPLDSTGFRTGGPFDSVRNTDIDNIWSFLRSDLRNTWWETFFQSLPWRVVRARIMIMKPRSCYTIHRDTSPRLHVAMKTNKDARFIFTDPADIIHLPADGHVWWIDTRHEHTAINAGWEPRWHLIMSLTEQNAGSDVCLDSNKK
jgi:hypothetical protein